MTSLTLYRVPRVEFNLFVPTKTSTASKLFVVELILRRKYIRTIFKTLNWKWTKFINIIYKSMQCAALKSHSGVMIAQPQRCVPFICKDPWNGATPSTASAPPTIRGEIVGLSEKKRRKTRLILFLKSIVIIQFRVIYLESSAFSLLFHRKRIK